MGYTEDGLHCSGESVSWKLLFHSSSCPTCSGDDFFILCKRISKTGLDRMDKIRKDFHQHENAVM